MLLKLQFEDPLSIGRDEDVIIVTVIETGKIFKTKDFFNVNSYLEKDSHVVFRRLTRQMKNDTLSGMLAKSQETIKSSMNGAVFVQFVMNLIMSASLLAMLGMFNAL